MADSIVVSVSELRSRLQDIRRDGMDYVEISLSEADEDLPACINFSACKSYDTQTWSDYEEVEAVPENEKLIEACLYGTHMSSNMN